jgi:C1A family cysteine protease
MSSDMMKQANQNPALITAMRGGHPVKSDLTAPNVIISSPGIGATVSGLVSISVSASDNVGVTSVTLKVDNNTTSISSTTSPFTLNWNSSSVANGSHSLSVTAQDAAGNATTSAPVQVNVSNAVAGDGIAPSVSFTSPANGASLNANTNITVNISSSDNVGVTSRSITIDGSQVSTGSSYTWNTSISGPHTLVAKAFDAAGNVGTSTISVTINTVVVPPPTLPSSYSLVMPPVMYQGSEGSCVAFAGVYARSAEQYYRSHAGSYSQSTNIFSPEFVFNLTKSSTSCSGSSLLTTFDLFVGNGVCTYASMPYSYTNGCTQMPDATQTTQASSFKIPSYSQVYDTDIQGIKAMLVANHALVSVITMDQSFYNATPGFIWKSFGTSYGSHALAVCGYDDAKHAWKVINQWGTNWGDAGYGWIDYDFFPTISSNLLVMNY